MSTTADAVRTIELFFLFWNSVIYYIAVFLAWLIPNLIVIAFLAYKSKPDDESFNKYINNIVKIMEIESFKLKTDSKLDRVLNKFVPKLKHVTNKKSIISNSYNYECCFFNLAMLRYNDEKRVCFLGIFGSWFPVYMVGMED